MPLCDGCDELRELERQVRTLQAHKGITEGLTESGLHFRIGSADSSVAAQIARAITEQDLWAVAMGGERVCDIVLDVHSTTVRIRLALSAADVPARALRV